LVGSIKDFKLCTQASCKDNKRIVLNFKDQDLSIIQYKIKNANAVEGKTITKDKPTKGVKGEKKVTTKTKKDIFVDDLKKAQHFTTDTTLNCDTVRKIIREAEQLNAINNPLETMCSYANGGETYVFDVSEIENWREHLTVDGYRWKNAKQPDHRQYTIWKSYVYDQEQQISTEFRKRTIIDNESETVVIQYQGDKSVAGMYPHGNMTKSTEPFIPKSNVYIQSKVIESKEENPTELLFDINRKTGEDEPAVLTQARDKEHIKSILHKLRKPMSFMGDELNSTFLAARAMGNYMKLNDATPGTYVI
jgi:hypothetical protein